MKKWMIVIPGLVISLACSSSHLKGQDKLPEESKVFQRNVTVSTMFYGIWQKNYGSGGEEKFVAELKEMGFNGVWLIGWSSGGTWLAEEKGFNVDKFLKLAQKNGIRVVIYNVLTSKRNFKDKDCKCAGEFKSKTCVNKPVVRKFVENKIGQLAQKWGKYKSLEGMHDDEPDIFCGCGYCDICKGKFKEWLTANYSPKKLTSHGIKDVSEIAIPKDKSNPFLYYAHRRFMVDSHADFVAWMNSTFKKLCPDKKFGICFAPWPYWNRPMIGSRAQLFRMADFLESEVSAKFDWRKVSYYYELFTSAAKHIPCVHYGFYPLEDLHPDAWQTVMHTDGVAFFSFAGLYYDFKPKYWRTGAPARWNKRDKSKGMIPEKVKMMKKINMDISKCSPYIYGVKTVPDIAIGVVELDNYDSHNQSAGAGESLYYEFFLSRHIPAQVVYLDYITKESISKHKVLLVPNGQSLPNKALKVIEEWVMKGGILICSKNTSTRDNLSLEREDYGLRKVLGISRKGGQTKITTAKAITVVKGNPVILSNEYGKGKSVVFMEGLNSYAKGEKSDLLKKILDSGMKKAGARYPLLITKGGEGIETNVRERAEGKQLTRVFYLLKMKDKASTSGIEARLAVPSGYKVKGLIAPISGKELTYKEKDGYVVFDVPAFELYEAVVLQLVKD